MNTYLIKSFSLRLLNEELEKITKDIPNIKCYPCNGSIEDSYIYMNNI